MSKYKLISLMCVCLGLQACVSRAPVPAPSGPVVIEERVIVDGEALPLPDDPVLRPESLGLPESSSPVVNNLMQTAQRHQREGNYAAADSSLERALRIEPRNARLWASLAEIKYAQQDWSAAIQLASRSNTLSKGNVYLLRRNWMLLANAHEQLGNTESAFQFREKLKEY